MVVWNVYRISGWVLEASFDTRLEAERYIAENAHAIYHLEQENI